MKSPGPWVDGERGARERGRYGAPLPTSPHQGVLMALLGYADSSDISMRR